MSITFIQLFLRFEVERPPCTVVIKIYRKDCKLCLYILLVLLLLLLLANFFYSVLRGSTTSIVVLAIIVVTSFERMHAWKTRKSLSNLLPTYLFRSLNFQILLCTSNSSVKNSGFLLACCCKEKRCESKTASIHISQKASSC